MGGNFKNAKRKERREETREEKGREGVKCQVMWLFVHLFMSLPVFVARGSPGGSGCTAADGEPSVYFRSDKVL